VRHGDDRWFDVVKWSLFAMLEAEELGLNSTNIDRAGERPEPDHPALRRRERRPGALLGVDNKWAYQIVKQVGKLRRELRCEPQAARLRARLEPPVEPGRTDVRPAAALDLSSLRGAAVENGRWIKKLTKRVLDNIATE